MTIRIKAKITGDKELEKKFNDTSRVKEPVAKYLDFLLQTMQKKIHL